MLQPGPDVHPEALDLSFTGTCEVSLTRAVLPYPDPEEHRLPGGRIRDLGLGVVMDGSDPVRADVLDLASAELRTVDLRGPLVILGWIFPAAHRAVERLLARGEDAPDAGRRLGFHLALDLLGQTGYTSLTRPVFLRLGFRDICQDLDLNEGTAVRLSLPEGRVARAHLGYETAIVVVRTGRSERTPILEEALADAFPGRDLLRVVAGAGQGTQEYHILLPIPRTIQEARKELRRLRRGFLHLLARFEPDRYRAARQAAAAFGERDSLAQIRAERVATPSAEKVGRVRGLAGPRRVH
jgi:hypothetical protein